MTMVDLASWCGRDWSRVVVDASNESVEEPVLREKLGEKVGERIWASQNGDAHGSQVGCGEEDGGGEVSRDSVGGHVRIFGGAQGSCGDCGVVAGGVPSELEAAGARDGSGPVLHLRRNSIFSI